MPEALARGIRDPRKKPPALGFGSARRPLLVSVRSGAAVSMPGMLETVLNVGLNPETVDGYDSSHRKSAPGLGQLSPAGARLRGSGGGAARRSVRANWCASPGGCRSGDRSANSTTARCGSLRARCSTGFEELTGKPFPHDPHEQLLRAAGAVFRSWDAPKAASYRRLNGIDDRAGTAVTVQTMVFGNAGGASGSGVGFTRDPATGEPELYLDFQFNGQGEDVVDGRRNQSRRPAPALEVAARVESTGGCRPHSGDRCSATRRISSSRSSAARCICCKRVPPNGRPGPPCGSQSTWWSRACITPREALARLAGIDVGGGNADTRRRRRSRPAIPASGTGAGGRDRRRKRTGCVRSGDGAAHASQPALPRSLCAAKPLRRISRAWRARPGSSPPQAAALLTPRSSRDSLGRCAWSGAPH